MTANYSSEQDDSDKVVKLNSEAKELSNRARKLLCRIQLRLNPLDNENKKEDDEFLSALSELVNQSTADTRESVSIESGRSSSGDFTRHWRTLEQDAVTRGRKLLKREWEVTKGGCKLWLRRVLAGVRSFSKGVIR
ncbi:hypothetical protein FRZ44_14390 [Hypericibacter terrae]|uniref:Uncharacterized protein n=1 Tax=Hypericibacter terrae TaxID=2602015 RepID=A0A5J6MGC7_9PROT|nr:hypothetical protein [Hypericibacter terrae]QEX16147.1 hypothetical protein FRZ44_14390 [Hypericibacter terrae]